MDWKITTTTEESELISVEDAKIFLRVDNDAEDDLIAAYIKAARVFCEQYSGRAWIEQTINLYMDAFPRCRYIRLPRPPLMDVTAAIYTDHDDIDHDIMDDAWVDTNAEPGRLHLLRDKSWPSNTDAKKVVITYTAGYTEMPPEKLQALRLMVGEFYERRENSIVGTSVVSMPFAVRALLGQDAIPALHPGGE